MPIYDGVGFDGGCDQDQEDDFFLEDLDADENPDPGQKSGLEDEFFQDRDPDDEKQ